MVIFIGMPMCVVLKTFDFKNLVETNKNYERL